MIARSFLDPRMRRVAQKLHAAHESGQIGVENRGQPPGRRPAGTGLE